MKSSDSKISVCIAAYNGEKFIAKQIDSIISQLGVRDEVIISDDGSTDNTCRIISSYSDTRIKLVHNPHPFPPFKAKRYKSYIVAKNFENALKKATGDYIFLSDQDDIWEFNKVSHSLSILQNNNINLVVHDASVIDEHNNTIAESYFKIVNSKTGFIRNVITNSYLGCCLVFDKKTLVHSLPFPNNLVAHDLWIGLIAEKIGKVAFIQNKLIKYRRHAGTVTNSSAKSSHTLISKLLIRFQFVMQYFMRMHKTKF